MCGIFTGRSYLLCISRDTEREAGFFDVGNVT